MAEGGIIGPENVGTGPTGSSEECNQAIVGDCTGDAAAVYDDTAESLCETGTIMITGDYLVNFLIHLNEKAFICVVVEN